MADSTPDSRQPVLFYDGECGLCNRAVLFLLRADRHARLRFAPLQSAPAQAFLRAAGLPTEDFDSLVFVRDWSAAHARQPLLRTDGACAALAETAAPWCWLAGFRILPANWRDAAYRWVARTRHRLGGRHYPRPATDLRWAERFLDR